MADSERDDGRHEDGDSGQIKVTDRRLFTRDGQLREDLAGEEDSSDDAAPEPGAAEAPPAESAGGEAGFERRSLDEPEGVDFTMLINAMAQPALIYLGEIPHPATGRAEINLDQARLQIDLLDVLRIKCRGNLTAEEDSLLDRILYRLRMVYVARSQGDVADGAPDS